ncbi:MAG TPA: iron ABC transporter permease [Candidatus Syntrophosphaera thermopropionivorans]|jgi:iron complex transport system permease protein|nr:iron ABC transporter permease [Candidatus Syntrophosphaera sp.]HPQ30301.1 iron ABC transporter permease [Candidatus Syntrophosphaera thermopropionivorans]HQF82416.1 iron ABC transporter permease [Candidatus Syntrophosphaera thermopropionivorans]HQK58171.1 iron ABC transporter permease [Candidatus Syntrophosphaera thermopropionivorans]HRQ98671.1 iron ABC transporter permease [Candidatus Syntrophosphaera sp.]
MKKEHWLIISLILIFLAIAALYLFIGNVSKEIVIQVRLPRMILTIFTGMTLAGIGSVYQLMLVNPLAEPYILGISSGSAFGAILFGVLGLTLLMPVGGFIGAALTLIIVWRLAQKKGSFDRSRLLIAGVIVGMFFSAGISLIMYLFQKDTMIILGTLMGNLGHIFTQSEWYFFLFLLVVSIVILGRLYFRSTALDIMSGGDIYAGSVGIDVQKVRKELFLLTSVLVGITVSYAGIIGFVGLIIPHIVRFFIPSGQRKIFLYSLITGGIFLLCCDLIAKNITVIELPVGVITSALGCPFFIWLLLKK